MATARQKRIATFILLILAMKANDKRTTYHDDMWATANFPSEYISFIETVYPQLFVANFPLSRRFIHQP